MELTKKKCIPCQGGTPPLTLEEINKYLPEIQGSWTLESQKPNGVNAKLKRDFEFKDFEESMSFLNKVADIANQEDHHPNMHVYYNKVTLELWTHKIFGLHENDFIMAAKINSYYRSR